MKNRTKIRPPIVVYHVAGIGDWKQVVDEQLQLLQQSGLVKDIRITYVGKELDWLEDRLALYDITYQIVRSDLNTDHCETFAMMEIDRLAKEERIEDPIMYIHTKGVSNPGNASKRAWRHLMESWVVRRWQVNMAYLKMFDAVGVNWIEGGPQHFSGTFWIANPDWIRRLPRFEEYHLASGLHRYTCELWIGAAQWCKALSLGCKNEPFWNFNYDYNQWLPKTIAHPPLSANPVTSESSFGDIFRYFHCDKEGDHSYGKVYDTLYPVDTRKDIQTILEVGVQAGRSLQCWDVAFPNAAIYGIDYETGVEVIGQRTQVFVCNSTKPRFVWETMKKWNVNENHFDLIIDDGSHKFCDQLATAAILQPYLKKNGTYIIEDIYPNHGASVLTRVLGGSVIDRRNNRKRFDDTMVIIGRDPELLKGLQEPSLDDIPTLFPGDDV